MSTTFMSVREGTGIGDAIVSLSEVEINRVRKVVKTDDGKSGTVEVIV